MKQHTQQTLALAGVAQAAFLVYQLSQNGIVAENKLTILLQSLFITDPKNTEDVYGNVDNLHLGLEVLQDIFSGRSSFFKSPVVMRYLFGMYYLEGKLNKRKNLLNSISLGLKSIEFQKDESELAFSDESIQQLAALYQNTISTLSFRIQVSGNMNYLKNEQVIHKIRALLLAGIRSAVLWRQVGGKPWHFMIYKKRINRDISLLLGTPAPQ